MFSRDARKRLLATAALIAFGVCVAATGIFLAHKGLDNADKIGSVGALLVALVGLLQLVDPAQNFLVWLRGKPKSPADADLAEGIAGAAPPADPYFTGRDAEISEIRAALTEHHCIGIDGHGGVGKSQLVAKYVDLFGRKYADVWWIRGETEEALASDLDAIASGFSDALTSRARLAEFFAKLRRQRRWLIVVDDLTDGVNMDMLLSGSVHGHIIVTSRQRYALVPYCLTLTDWTDGEAIAFLQRRASKDAPIADLEDLIRVLHAMPLAISQAANFMQRTGISAKEYLRLYEIERKAILAVGKAFNRSDTVATVWKISLQAAQEDAPGCPKLLILCSLYAVGSLPVELPQIIGRQRMTTVLGLPSPVGVRFRSQLRRDLTYRRWLGALATQKLVSVDNRQIRVHPMLAEVTKASLKPGDLRTYTFYGARCLLGYVLERKGEVAVEELWRPLIPHVTAIGQLALKLKPPIAAWTAFGARVTWYVWIDASLLLSAASRHLLEEEDNEPEGRKLAEMSLALAERCHMPLVAFRGNYAPGSWYAVVKALECCAASELQRGDSNAAKSLFERALRVLHPKDLRSRAGIVGGLAVAERNLGEIDEAQELIARELETMRNGLSETDPYLRGLLALQEDLFG